MDEVQLPFDFATSIRIGHEPTYPSNDTSIEYWVRLVFLHLSLYNKPKVKNKKDRTFVAKPVRKGPIPVNEAEISRYITETFEGVDVVVASATASSSTTRIVTYRRITGFRL
jgi:hypothetical protein